MGKKRWAAATVFVLFSAVGVWAHAQAEPKAAGQPLASGASEAAAKPSETVAGDAGASSPHFANVPTGEKGKGGKLPCPVNDLDEVRMLLTLRERHTVLLAKEAQLHQREAMLKRLEAQLSARLSHVEVALGQIEHKLLLGDAGEKEREARLQTLVDTVGRLSAKKAAPMLAQADPPLVAELFRRLGPMRASALLAVMPPAKAGKLIDYAAQSTADANDTNPGEKR